MLDSSMKEKAEEEEYRYIVLEKKEGVGILYINRPEAKNALNGTLVEELRSAFTRLGEDPGIRVIVITGKNRVFVAGADIKEMAGLSVSATYEIASRMKELHHQMICSTKPVIACIEGYCLGGGMELALACDIRIAAPDAVFGLPEIKLGIIPGGGGTQRLLETVGPAVASHLIFTGDFISAERAYEIKLISEIAEDVQTTALQLACRLAQGSQTALAAAKRMINGQLQQCLAGRLEAEMYEFSLLFDYPDSLEGMSAFMEKRKPVFK
jgi:enoyl-CoA hydratase/carnithine racemase